MSNPYLAMDDEKIALNCLVRCIKRADANADVHSFLSIESALSGLNNGLRPIAAFLDISVPGAITGIEFAKMLRQISPATDIVFVTGHEQFVLEAYGIRASGYLLKPVTVERIRDELENLPHHIMRNDNGVFTTHHAEIYPKRGPYKHIGCDANAHTTSGGGMAK